ncbi:hypothetical protein BS50DRAFT_327493 [Corynespora cassiicola Philippines]|uniref:Peptide N-acetyl-beta-D-glucosaminyl asparaginase amidase A N-terminal domain-containing protein n=1 Tax=Corynespora cassiicola Philippines TaxID=1448308 RepID=A0A2T2NTZ7_CORCC|nr:hypothetical protein BS50DRAFT_327493 [Corynespora cassiicola Philippines]
MTGPAKMIPSSNSGVSGFHHGTSIPHGDEASKNRVVFLHEQEQDGGSPYGSGPAKMGGRRQGNNQPLAWGSGILPFVFCLLILITLPKTTLALLAPQRPHLLTPALALSSRAPNQSSPLLQCLQVSPPVLSPAAACQQTLMVHTFGWSYGKPFVGAYSPPGCSFNRVTFNFTVTSAGRQFDRLALMFFNDTEIFRTSTAEPTPGGIIWTYQKDMSNFVSLFREPQKIIFDLGNLIDDTYTGSWNTILTATFFTVDETSDAADLIVPVSARRSAEDSPSGFVVPDSKAVNALALPKNAKRAVFSISACGQAAEEFWWSNVLSSDTQVFGNETTLYGYSPFREIQLYIDGTLAGVAWPFPVIFTGGVVPGFWRPVVGIDAFDLKEDEIDISPFLTILSDGEEHSFEIRVVGIEDDGSGNGKLTERIGSNWVVTGKVFVWLDASDAITTGSALTVTAPEPVLDIQSSVRMGANGTVESLDYSIQVTRSFSVSSTIRTSTGSEVVTWTQNLAFSNHGHLTQGSNNQINKQTTSGTEVSSGDYTRSFEYPLWVSSSYEEGSGGNFTLQAEMNRGKHVQKIGALAFPPETESPFTGVASRNTQNGTASYSAVPAQKTSYGSGITEQLYSLAGVSNAAALGKGETQNMTRQGGAELYRRHVLAANNSLILDEESFGDGVVRATWNYPTHGSDAQGFAKLSIKAILGRGPF